MDKIVVVLIGAGVCCIVIGLALFLKLCKIGKQSISLDAKKNMLDEEYEDNFKECFNNTGNIEEALEQLSHIYIDNQYMYNLIVNAIDYIKDGQGDYETALEGINVDNDINIMKIHNDAIKKSLNLESKVPTQDVYSAEENNNIECEQTKFDEDEDLEEIDVADVAADVDDASLAEETKGNDNVAESETSDEDDLDGFKIG